MPHVLTYLPLNYNYNRFVEYSLFLTLTDVSTSNTIGVCLSDINR